MFGERIRVCFVLSREFYIVQSKNTYKASKRAQYFLDEIVAAIFYFNSNGTLDRERNLH